MIPAAEDITNLDANGGKSEGHDSDQSHCDPDIHITGHGQGETHSQSVDAGGDGHDEHGFCGEVRVMLFAAAVAAECFLQHIGANNSQQHKGDPVVECFNGIGEENAEEKSDNRHQCLETAEPDAAA